MKSRIFGIVCSLVLAGALTTNQQVRAAESDAPDSTRNKDRVPAPPPEHPNRAWQRAEIVNPDSVENKDQYKLDAR
jgi:hypothetical protein